MPAKPSMENDALLSIADIARHFSLPESTVRFYCKKFAHYLPSLGQGRRRRYSARALAVMDTIVRSMRTTRSCGSVEAALAGTYPPIAETTLSTQIPVLGHYAVSVPERGTIRLLEKQTHAMEGIAAALRILAMRQEELARLSQDARQASEENIRLREELGILRHRVDTAEKIQQDDLEQLRACMSRLIGQNNNGTGFPSGSNSKQ